MHSRIFWSDIHVHTSRDTVVSTVLATICYVVLMFLAVISEAQSQGILSGPMRTGAGPCGRHTMAVPEWGRGPGVHVRPYMYMNQPPYETAIGWRPYGPAPVLIGPDRIH